MRWKKYVLAAALAFFVNGGTADAQALTSGDGLPEDNVVELKVDLKVSGPTLLFSDSPEMVYEKGVLYRDTVSGDVRVFFHHVNATGRLKKIAVMVKNEDNLRPVEYKVTRRGVGESAWHYMMEGKRSQELYFKDGQKQQQGELGFGRSVELIDGRGFLLAPNKLLVGTIDLHLSRPAQISVLLCEPRSDLELFNESAPILPMDEHPLRGTFKNADWHYTVKQPIDSDNGSVYMLELASEEQGFAKGIDATTGKPAVNYGNYGIMYKVDFNVAGQKQTEFTLNPLGGLFAGYGVLQTEGKNILTALPQMQVSIGDSYDDLLHIASLRQGESSFIWSPPGASNLPVRFYWLPEQK